eukprot:1672355-Lingulodinium_polyedra.AAC.1
MNAHLPQQLPRFARRGLKTLGKACLLDAPAENDHGPLPVLDLPAETAQDALPQPTAEPLRQPKWGAT